MHGSWSAGFQDVTTSDVVMFVGNNPLVSATSSYIAFPASNAKAELRRLKADGLAVIVIDPRRTETAAWADVHLQPRPGTDSFVLAGMIRLMIDSSLHDASFVTRFADGLDELRRTVDPFDETLVEERSGVPGTELREAARLFAQGPRGCAVGGTGINMAPHPVLNEYLLLCLNTLGGRYVRAGEQVSNPGVLTHGRRPVASARGPRAIWGRGPQPRTRGLSTLYDQMPASALADEILTPGEGQIRALIVSGGNPAVALPDQKRAVEALRSLDLLVCLDVRPTATTQLADYVIGCTLSLEKADATLAHDLRFARPFAQYAPPVVPRPGDLLDEWEVFHGLAARMGTPWDLGGRIGMPIPVDLAGGLPVGRPPTADDLWELLCGGARVPLDEVRAHPHGLSPDLDPVIVTEPDGESDERLQLADPGLMEELRAVIDESDDLGYPFRLISRRMWEYINSWGQDVPSVRRRYGANPAFLNPQDMTELGITEDELVTIASPHGEIVGFVRAAEDIPPGVVSMAHCWGSTDEGDEDVRQVGSSTNRLVDSRTDLSQLVGMARQSAIPVRVTRCDPGDGPLAVAD